MEISTILDPACCDTGLKAKDKDSALRILSGLAARSTALADTDPQKIYHALAGREEQGTTAFGKEVALPHAHLPDLDRFLLFIAVFPKGAPFDALDRKKVKIFIVILGPPEQVNEHLRILASVSQVIGHTNVKQELLSAAAPETVVETFLRNAVTPVRPAARARQSLKLLLVNLYLEEFLLELLELFLDMGIEGATIIDSSGMGRYLSNVPMFAEFIGFMNANSNYSKTILALVPENRMEELVERIEKITGDLDTRQGAVILAMDVLLARGTMKML